MKARIHITPKPDILDPQGKAVAHALGDLGYQEVTEVRVGKYLTLEFNPVSGQDAKARLEEMCRRLLANINVETYSIEISEK
jgi:phosphoribosylformylglycinamidine synthase subunit PurS